MVYGSVDRDGKLFLRFLRFPPDFRAPPQQNPMTWQCFGFAILGLLHGCNRRAFSAKRLVLQVLHGCPGGVPGLSGGRELGQSSTLAVQFTAADRPRPQLARVDAEKKRNAALTLLLTVGCKQNVQSRR